MAGTEQTAHQRCKDAVIGELIAVGAAPDNPIELYLIGPVLVATGFTQEQIVSALDSLVYEKRIEYAGGNRVRFTAR